LSEYVISADTVNTLKNLLENFLFNQDTVYDYTSDIAGIGNRSLTSLDDTSAL